MKDIPELKPQERAIPDTKKVYQYFQDIEKGVSCELTLINIKQFAWNEIRKKCPDFMLTKENKKLLADLSDYVLGEGELNPAKGIYLYGAYGVGKSLLMSPFMTLLKVQQKTSISLVAEFNDTEQFKHYCIGNWYFDDLGAEKLPKFAKAGSDPLMTEVLQERYSKTTQGFDAGRTFVSSNLSPKAFNDFYGARVGSRMNEMFNIIFLDGEDYRQMK